MAKELEPMISPLDIWRPIAERLIENGPDSVLPVRYYNFTDMKVMTFNASFVDEGGKRMFQIDSLAPPEIASIFVENFCRDFNEEVGGVYRLQLEKPQVSLQPSEDR